MPDGSLLEDGDEIKGWISPRHIHECHPLPVPSGSIGHVARAFLFLHVQTEASHVQAFLLCISSRHVRLYLTTGCHDAFFLHVSVFRSLFPRATFARDPLSSICPQTYSALFCPQLGASTLALVCLRTQINTLVPVGATPLPLMHTVSSVLPKREALLGRARNRMPACNKFNLEPR